MLFRKGHIQLILEGRKTQTRRRSGRYKAGDKYKIRSGWFKRAKGEILITAKFRHRLGDISPEEAEKEGGYTPETFLRVWREINKDYDPDEIVWVYEFVCLNHLLKIYPRVEQEGEES